MPNAPFDGAFAQKDEAGHLTCAPYQEAHVQDDDFVFTYYGR